MLMKYLEIAFRVISLAVPCHCHLQPKLHVTVCLIYYLPIVQRDILLLYHVKCFSAVTRPFIQILVFLAVCISKYLGFKSSNEHLARQ